MNSDNLKPCPFCGGEAVEGKVKFNGKESERDGWLGCRECRVFMNYMNGERGRKMAAEIWNTRHERTCRNEFDRCFAFECSECGVNVEGGDMLGHNSSEGAFNFCPNCGAKVIE